MKLLFNIIDNEIGFRMSFLGTHCFFFLYCVAEITPTKPFVWAVLNICLVKRYLLPTNKLKKAENRFLSIDILTIISGL